MQRKEMTLVSMNARQLPIKLVLPIGWLNEQEPRACGAMTRINGKETEINVIIL